MKITYTLTPDDIAAATAMWMTNKANLKAAIEAWMVFKNAPVDDSNEYTMNPDGSVTVVVSPLAPLAPVVSQKPILGDTSLITPFARDGADAPIRGNFALTAAQLDAVCVLAMFSPYAKYIPPLVSNCVVFGLNPLFVLADLVNQGVNPSYNNPWGISTDNYPYGPNGAQLGESNGHIKDGPRKFSDAEWQVAFNRQFQVVATGKAYQSAKTIAEWALIDAPPGAANDPHGTNAQEGADVGAIYNKLVTALQA